MRRYALLLSLLGLVALVLGAGCTRRKVTNSVTGVSKEYFLLLKDGKIQEAEKYATFDNDASKKVWEEQANAYAKQLKAGGRQFWGDVAAWGSLPGTATQEYAYITVQWRFLAGLGWMMGNLYSYKMTTVNGQWKVICDEDLRKRGVPYISMTIPGGT